jgi:STE24 endopeptidase
MADAPAPFLEVFIGFSTIITLWELYLDSRQLKKNKETEPPDAIKDLAPIDRFRKSQLYQADKLSFSMKCSIIQFVANMFEVVYIWPYLWGQAGSLVGENEYYKAVVWQIMLSFVSYPISIPISLYSDFVIEARHGFNKKTISLFITDTIKNALLGIVFTILLVPLVIYVVRWGGESFYWYIWIVCQVLMLVFMFIYPTLIMPLFNKYEPLHDVDLRNQIEAFAASLKFPESKLFQMDGSKRSAHSNAVMFGFWKNKRIVIFDTLLQTQVKLEKQADSELGCEFTLDGSRLKVHSLSTKESASSSAVGRWNEVHQGRNDELKEGDFVIAVDTEKEGEKMVEAAQKLSDPAAAGTLILILERKPFTTEEILAVLCHEIGHWFHAHVLRMLVISSVHIFVLFRLYGFVMYSAPLFQSFGYSGDERSIMVGLNIFMLMFSPVETVVGFGMTLLTRKNEYQADDFAVKQQRATELQTGLRKLCIENLGDLNPDPLYAWFHHSHPALVERLANIKMKDQLINKKTQ